MLHSHSNHPLVSIIIPILNREHLIIETLNSVLNQTYDNWECIIVDDGSVDNTVYKVQTMVKKDVRFKYYKRPKNYREGGNGARNYGFIKSKGHFIKWFDSDDILEPNIIFNQVKDCNKNQKDVSICSFRMFYGSLSNIQSLYPNLIDNPKALFHSFINGQSIINLQMTLWRRTIVEKYRFDENLTRAQDLAFVYDVLKSNINKVVISFEFGCWIRNHEKSITSNFRRGNFQALKSEYQIRELIFNENFSAKESINEGTLRMLLYSYRKLLIHNYNRLYFKKLYKLTHKISFVKNVKIFILICLSLVYILVKRGNYQIGMYIKSF